MHHRSRRAWLALHLSVALFLPGRAAAQEAHPDADVPGLLTAERCERAPFPAALPELHEVADVDSLRAALRAAGVDKRLVLGLRSASGDDGVRVHVVERKATSDVADRAVEAVRAAVHAPLPGAPTAFRLRVEAEQALVLTLERSQVCGAAPGTGHLQQGTSIVSPDELQRMRREAEVMRTRLRRMVLHVLVDAEGKVRAAILAQSSGDASFDATHTEALTRRPFTTPTKVDGVPVTAWVTVRGDHGLPRR